MHLDCNYIDVTVNVKAVTALETRANEYLGGDLIMTKTTNCVFSGKELTGDYFSGDDFVVENTAETTLDEQPKPKEKLTPWGIVLKIRYFFPMISTIGWLVAGMNLDKNQFLVNFGIVLAIVGIIVALTAAPLRMLKFPFLCIAGCFTICRAFIPVYGVADVMAAVLGVALGLVFGVGAIVVFPAVFTIQKFFEEFFN